MAVSFLRSAGMGGDRVGNSQKRAKTIKLNKGTGNFSDRIGGKDTNDYFKFSVSDRSRASVAVKGFKGAVNLQIFDGQGKAISTPIKRKQKTKSIDAITLDSGNYYIRVFPGSKGKAITQYKLQIAIRAEQSVELATGNVYKSDQLLVKFKANLSSADRQKLAKSLGADIENLVSAGQTADALESAPIFKKFKRCWLKTQALRQIS
jgi:hypothetical protein